MSRVNIKQFFIILSENVDDFHEEHIEVTYVLKNIKYAQVVVGFH